MKFYETHYDDYLKSLSLFNFHSFHPSFPYNYIFYGSSGTGKYSQVLNLLQQFSPTLLKFENKIYSTVDKPFYINISDIHYEIDISLLGCNSKIVWHDLFTQIVEIISLKPHKMGFIVCKNFHDIHNELLEILYSYMNVLSLKNTFIHQQFTPSLQIQNQQTYNYGTPIKSEINIKFILITEHLSFIPTNIMNKCLVVSLNKPSKEKLIQGIGIQKPNLQKENIQKIMNNIDAKQIYNFKEIYSFPLIDKVEDLPKDNFNVICENIIQELIQYNKEPVFENYTNLRDIIYDILIYNIDPLETICHILFYFLTNKLILSIHVDEILQNINTFIIQYGNNYRSFFHLEYFLFSLLFYHKKTTISNMNITPFLRMKINKQKQKNKKYVNNNIILESTTETNNIVKNEEKTMKKIKNPMKIKKNK